MADVRELVSGKYLEYKGLPLVREGDTICYGDMEGKCILILEIMSYKKVDGKDLPDNIIIQVVDPKNQSGAFFCFSPPTPHFATKKCLFKKLFPTVLTRLSRRDILMVR